MKRWFFLSPIVAALALLFTGHYVSTITQITPPAIVAKTGDQQPDIDEVIKKLFAKDEEAPAKLKIVKPKLEQGEHWVPIVRFTNTGINKSSVDKVSEIIQAVNDAGAEAIVLEISTLGGEVPSGYEFGRAIERSHAPVYCVVDGDAASMGFYVLQSCDVRLMTKRSVLMIHEPHIQGPEVGTANIYRNYEQLLHAATEAMLEHEAVKMKVSREVIRKHIENGQDWNILWEEALKIGAVDKIAPSVEAVAYALKKGWRGHI